MGAETCITINTLRIYKEKGDFCAENPFGFYLHMIRYLLLLFLLLLKFLLIYH